MPKCRRHKWISVSVYFNEQCVMLGRCKICKEFGNSYCLAPQPFLGSVAISLSEVPHGKRQHIEAVIKQVDSYPVYDL